MHVFLDDYRACPKGFVLATNAEECLMLLREGDVDILSLDYELGRIRLTAVRSRHPLYEKVYFRARSICIRPVCLGNARCTRCYTAINRIR